jgi:Flp pilus assembly protein TadB
MEITEIIFALLLLSLFVIINFLDRWSTSTLFKFNDKTSNDEVFRNRMLAYRKSKGKLNMELNSLARVFMKKYGIEKGMKIFTVIWEIPLLISIFVSLILGIIEFAFVVGLVGFYIGGLYVQILRARRAEKETEIVEGMLREGK